MGHHHIAGWAKHIAGWAIHPITFNALTAGWAPTRWLGLPHSWLGKPLHTFKFSECRNRNNSVCCSQLQLWPIRELLSFSITNQKARSGAEYIKGFLSYKLRNLSVHSQLCQVYSQLGPLWVGLAKHIAGWAINQLPYNANTASWAPSRLLGQPHSSGLGHSAKSF